MRRLPAPWAGATARCAPVSIGRSPACARWSTRARCRRRPLMATGEHNRTQNALGEYWDALNQGLTSRSQIDLDPTLVTTIHRVRTLDDARSPDAAFVTRLEQ